MDSPRLARIHCVISRGMFENEYAAEVAVPGEGAVSLFVDEGLVRVDPETKQATLLVTVVPNGSGEGRSTVLLPSETFENGNRWLHLPTSHLHPE